MGGAQGTSLPVEDGREAGGAPFDRPMFTPYPSGYAYPGEFPLQLDVAYQDRYVRWLPVAKPFILAPHYVAALILEAAMLVAALVAGAAVLITGRYPYGLFRFFVAGGRWLARIAAYLYLLTDRYPPFALYEQPHDTVRFTVDYPEGGRMARWRPICAWVLVLPHYAVLFIRYVATYLLLLGGFWSVVFTGALPRSLFDFVVGTLRMHARVNAYAFFLVETRPRLQL